MYNYNNNSNRNIKLHVVICYRLSLCSCLFGYDAKPHPLDDTYILVLDTN